MGGSETVLQECRRKCEAGILDQLQVQVNHEAIRELATSLDLRDIRASGRKIRLPFKFNGLEEELSFLALSRLLDFGTGYEPELRNKKDKTAKDVIQLGVIGIHMSNEGLTAKTFQSTTTEHIVTMFGIEGRKEVDSGIPGVTMSEPGPLSEWAARLTKTVNDAGNGLEASGHNSLGACIIECMKDCTASDRPARASYLISELVDTVPGFADNPVINGQSIPFCRKAQLLAADLYVRFSQESPLFAFQDISQLCGDSGAAAIAYFRYHGGLECCSDISNAIAKGETMPRGTEEGRLRAACSIAVAMLASELSVDVWKVNLWLQNTIQGSQRPEGMLLHVTTNTEAY